MTSYHGGKQRIGKQLAETIFDISTDIEDETDFTIRGYCEPFCGMLGVYQHIPDLFEHEDFPSLTYKAGDTNESVIKMWKAVQRGWVPPNSCSESTYNRLKNQKGSSAEKAYIGHQYSFGGQYFVGFIGKYGKPTSYKSTADKVCRIAEELRDVKFTVGPYTQFSNLHNYIIYCDPPYSKTECRYKEGGSASSFNNDSFWNWVRRMSRNNIVFVSEYTAPRDFKQIFKRNRKASPSKGQKAKGTEKLFIHDSWL